MGEPREVLIGYAIFAILPSGAVVERMGASEISVTHDFAVAVRRVAELEDAIRAAIAEHEHQADAWADEEFGFDANVVYHRERAAILRAALSGTPSDPKE